MKRATIALIAAALAAGLPLAILAPTVSEAYAVEQTWGYLWFSKEKQVPATQPSSWSTVVVEHRAWHTPVADLGRIDRNHAGWRISSKFCEQIQAGLSGEDRRVYDCGGYWFAGFNTRAEADVALKKRIEEFRASARAFPRTRHLLTEVPTPTQFSRAPGVITLGPSRPVAPARTTPSVPAPPSDAQAAARRAADEAAQRTSSVSAGEPARPAGQAPPDSGFRQEVDTLVARIGEHRRAEAERQVRLRQASEEVRYLSECVRGQPCAIQY